MKAENDQLEMLRKMLSEHQRQFEEAQAIVKREEPICHHLRHLIGSLVPGGKLDMPAAVAAGLAAANRPLLRNGEFEGMSLLDAVSRILAEVKRPLHADDLTKRIFSLRNGVDFGRAKNALVGDLVRGVKKGRFKRAGKNIYVLPDGAKDDVAA